MRRSGPTNDGADGGSDQSSGLSAYGSSPAVFLRRTMSGSKRPAEEEDMRSHGLDLRNLRTNPTMGRSSTLSAMSGAHYGRHPNDSTNSGWSVGSVSSQSRYGGNEEWNFDAPPGGGGGFGGASGRGAGGSGASLSSGGTLRREEKQYKLSTAGNLAGAGVAGNKPFHPNQQGPHNAAGGGLGRSFMHSASDITDMLSSQRRSQAGLEGGLQQSKRIARPTGAEFVNLMGLQRPQQNQQQQNQQQQQQQTQPGETRRRSSAVVRRSSTVTSLAEVKEETMRDMMLESPQNSQSSFNFNPASIGAGPSVNPFLEMLKGPMPTPGQVQIPQQQSGGAGNQGTGPDKPQPPKLFKPRLAQPRHQHQHQRQDQQQIQQLQQQMQQQMQGQGDQSKTAAGIFQHMKQLQELQDSGQRKSIPSAGNSSVALSIKSEESMGSFDFNNIAKEFDIQNEEFGTDGAMNQLSGEMGVSTGTMGISSGSLKSFSGSLKSFGDVGDTFASGQGDAAAADRPAPVPAPDAAPSGAPEHVGVRDGADVEAGELGAMFEPTPLSAELEEKLVRRRSSGLEIENDDIQQPLASAGGDKAFVGIAGMGPLSVPAPVPSASGSNDATVAGEFVSSLNSMISGAAGANGGGAGSSGEPQLSVAAFQAQVQAQMQAVQKQQGQAQQSQAQTQAQPQPQQLSVGSSGMTVQAQLQHVAQGTGGMAAAAQLGNNLTGSGPRDANWMMNAILQLNRVGPRTPNRDGMLPIHLACLYCPNDKKLVGHILIENPDSATFAVQPRKESDDKDAENAEQDPQDVIISLTSNALAASRKKMNPSAMVGQLQGSYPLHIALRSGGGEKVTYEVVKLLTLSGPEILTTTDTFGAVPLSIALQNKVGSQIIRYLLERDKSAASMPDRQDNYPLHFACADVRGKKRYSLSVIRLVLSAYPDALHKRNSDGMTPLDLANGPDSKGSGGNNGDAIVDFLQKSGKKDEDSKGGTEKKGES